jgi:glycosyltransferase involved in cell wall biosynthesis
MQAIAELFDQTEIAMPIEHASPPSGTHSLIGHNVSVLPLAMPPGRHLRRKLALFLWMALNLGTVWQAVREADAVHAPIPGDIGTIGILVALAQRKPLFVRYCGRWGKKETFAEHFWHWLLVRIADGRNVVLATGGGEDPPSPKNGAIDWIFSTSMRQAEIDAYRPRRPWQRGEPLRLITVGRLEGGKNADQVIRALKEIRQHYSQTTLDVVGDGGLLSDYRQLALDLELNDAVTFRGKVDHAQVLALLNQAHIFCFPTDSEGFPKAVHEALACGLPVVTTPVSVLPTLIGEKNGVLIEAPQAEQIAQAVLSIITDEDAFAAMVRHTQDTARAYTLEAWRDAIGERLHAAWGRLRTDG